MAYKYSAVGQFPADNASGSSGPKYPGGGEDPKYPDGSDPKYPGGENDLPSPADLSPLTVPTSPTQMPAAPMMPGLPPMTSAPSPTTSSSTPTFMSSLKDKIMSPDGPLGVPWRWWVLGGVAVLIYRARSKKVTANSRRRRRSR